jgi:hypothetical protein
MDQDKAHFTVLHINPDNHFILSNTDNLCNLVFTVHMFFTVN